MLQFLIAPLTELGKTFLENRRESKKHKYELEKIRREGEIERAKAAQRVEADYDLAAIQAQQYSWRDEFLTLLMSAPFIGCFIPMLQDYVLRGFEILDKTPLWYQVSFVGIVAATFGLRWWFKKQSFSMVNQRNGNGHQPRERE